VLAFGLAPLFCCPHPGGDSVRTGKDIRKKPVNECAVCGADLSRVSSLSDCPVCGNSPDATRAYKDNYEGYAVERSPYHNYKPPKAYRIA